DVERILSDLQRKGEELLREAGSQAGVTLERSADGRFVGQLHDLTVPLPSRALRTDDVEAIGEMFKQRYIERYGHLPQQVPLEFLSWRVTVAGPRPQMPNAEQKVVEQAGRGGVTPPVHRRAYFGQAYGFMDVAVYNRYALAAGDIVQGPAIVEERESTAIFYPGMTGRVDAHGNLVIDTGGHS
ncbi:MAG: methylhydantoinase, partial [Chloroflexi bacterium]|nr:methylhydantoinase [Chloroflexota bacterium]